MIGELEQPRHGEDAAASSSGSQLLFLLSGLMVMTGFIFGTAFYLLRGPDAPTPGWIYGLIGLTVLLALAGGGLRFAGRRAQARDADLEAQAAEAEAYAARGRSYLSIQQPAAADAPQLEGGGPLEAEIARAIFGLERDLGRLLERYEARAEQVKELEASLEEVAALEARVVNQAEREDLAGARGGFETRLKALSQQQRDAEGKLRYLARQHQALREGQARLNVRAAVDRLKAASLEQEAAPVLSAPRGDGVQELLDVIEGYLESFEEPALQAEARSGSGDG